MANKRKKNNQETPPKEKRFDLNPEYYEQMDAFEVYSSEKKATKIFGVRNKGADDEPYIKARTRSKTPYGWRYVYGTDIHKPSHLTRFIQGLFRIARKLGWRIKQDENIERLKSELREREEAIVDLEKTNKDLRKEHEELMATFRKKQEEILRSGIDNFKSDAEQLQKLISENSENKISEQDLQNFLYERPWFFGTEYVNAEPQKLRGTHSKFDFYLERFNKTNDIIEIKLVSDPIINKDGGINAKVLQAVDQLISYMESSQAAAHSRMISEEEGIHELRPRGIVIIGNDSSEQAKKKLHMWNYQFAHITILTYSDVLERAKSVLHHLQTTQKS